jgi:hypothetical protein
MHTAAIEDMSEHESTLHTHDSCCNHRHSIDPKHWIAPAFEVSDHQEEELDGHMRCCEAQQVSRGLLCGTNLRPYAVYPACQNIVSRCSQRLQGWHRSASKRGLAYRPAFRIALVQPAASALPSAKKKKPTAPSTTHSSDTKHTTAGERNYQSVSTLRGYETQSWLHAA